MLLRADTDLTYRAKLKELFHRDVLFAFNAFFFTLDVRRRPMHHQPFCTYDYQDEVILKLVDHINRGEDLPIEKSRDMGASWMIILVFLWFWLDPKGGTDFLLGSRIENYVDKKGDMRTLMQKARYALYKLPGWLRPEGFNDEKHDNFMRLTNPQTGASITGESNNANFSTGGRYAGILYDEFAKWEGTDTSAWTAGGDATPCRIPNSTPFGAAGQHFELVTSGRPKVVMHWSKHPRKAEGLYCVWPKLEEAEDWIEDGKGGKVDIGLVDENHWIGLRSPWYDKECARRKPSEIAQELDIDYIGAGNPVFEGRAGKRLQRLLKLPKQPAEVYRILPEEAAFEKLPVIPESFENCLTVYDLPSPTYDYVLSCDVAEGKEQGDYSIIKVLRRDNRSCAASFFSRYDETYVSLVMKLVWDFYTFGANRPWWAVETTGLGLTVFDQCVIIHQMTNAFMMPTYDTAKGSVSYRKGWWTSGKSKNVLIGGFKEWLAEGSGWVDHRCIAECITFVRDKNGKPNAKEGCNDDEVMCWGIALQVDLAVPVFDRPRETQLHQTGLPKSPYENFPKIEELTVEDRCLQQALEALPLLQQRSHPLIDYMY